MHLASSHSFSMARNSTSARKLNTTKYGVRRPATTTEIGDGVIARQMTMSQTAWIFAAAAATGQGRENVW